MERFIIIHFILFLDYKLTLKIEGENRLTTIEEKKPGCQLIKRGVAKKQAVSTVYTNRRTWALSHTKAVEKAFPNRWFSDTIKQIIVSDKKLDHWFGQDVWVKLA